MMNDKTSIKNRLSLPFDDSMSSKVQSTGASTAWHVLSSWDILPFKY
jgi:hypothetical protein